MKLSVEIITAIAEDSVPYIFIKFHLITFAEEKKYREIMQDKASGKLELNSVTVSVVLTTL